MKGLTILDEQTVITLYELSDACQVSCDLIIELIEYGIIDPLSSHEPWHFHASMIKRSQKALRLKQAFDINLSGIAMVIDLLEERDTLLHRLTLLEKLIDR